MLFGIAEHVIVIVDMIMLPVCSHLHKMPDTEMCSNTYEICSVVYFLFPYQPVHLHNSDFVLLPHASVYVCVCVCVYVILLSFELFISPCLFIIIIL